MGDETGEELQFLVVGIFWLRDAECVQREEKTSSHVGFGNWVTPCRLEGARVLLDRQQVCVGVLDGGALREIGAIDLVKLRVGWFGAQVHEGGHLEAQYEDLVRSLHTGGTRVSEAKIGTHILQGIRAAGVTVAPVCGANVRNG